MTRIIKLSFFLIYISSSLLAQEIDSAYFDSKWRSVNSKKFKYLRICEYTDSLVKITDYYKTDSVQMIGFAKKDSMCRCENIEGAGNKNRFGPYKWFTKAGIIENFKVFDPLNNTKSFTNIYPDSLLDKFSKDMELYFDAGYYKTGVLRACGFIIDNCNKYGTWIFYRKDGSSVMQDYLYGILHGKSIYFNPAGEVYLEIDYENGKRHGKEIWYRYKHGVKYIQYFEEGKKTFEEYKQLD